MTHEFAEDTLEGETTTKAYNPPLTREKKARRSVLIADRIADRTITIGGILVIIAVLGILVFLVSETLPLFKGGSRDTTFEYALKEPPGIVLNMTMDDYKTLALILSKKGKVQIFHVKTGTLLTRFPIDFKDKNITAFAATQARNSMVFGFSDGTVQFAQITFDSEILPADQLPNGLRKLDDRDSTDGTFVYSKIPGNQFRKISVQLDFKQTLTLSESNRPLKALDYHLSGEAERQIRSMAAVDIDGLITLNKLETRINLLTGKEKIRVRQTELPPLPTGVEIHEVLVTEKADVVFVADRAGKIYRYNTESYTDPVLAEITRVLPAGVTLNELGFLFGGQSIVVCGGDGSLNIYFLLEDENAGTVDGRSLQRTRIFERTKSPVVLFDPSIRGKSFVTAEKDGLIRVLHGTSQKILATFRPDEPVTEYRDILLAPRMDGVMALQKDGRVLFGEFSVPHPETTFKTLFQKVWYEGSPGPTYTWQSSAATDDYESKLSLIPLIFGTIKAALYSLLFAIPIAILGAVYTSEFLHSRVRAVVKPTMEMMASLPSVVLGFVAALVMAPVVDTWIAAIILAFVVFPVSLMLAAYLWQLLPLKLAMRWQGIPKFILIGLVVIGAFMLSIALGGWFEGLFFQGDFKAWLNRDLGGPEPFLFLITLPISFVLTTWLSSRLLGRGISDFMVRMTRFQGALFDLLRWVAFMAASLVLSYALAHLLALLGADVRGTFVDTYVQRNTLVVGFAMGFAVIPIIYTIAEDALNAVPEHLRAASLGCGATPWQTAIHVVLPTAISGVFSAVMIGMGRAVGETMIVVMAAGNTPLMDWNIFNGLRALSATIAVELPEAVKDGTLYRVLFLSGLVLFAMTFVINTAAELIRLHFRKRTIQL